MERNERSLQTLDRDHCGAGRADEVNGEDRDHAGGCGEGRAPADIWIAPDQIGAGIGEKAEHERDCDRHAVIFDHGGGL